MKIFKSIRVKLTLLFIIIFSIIIIASDFFLLSRFKDSLVDSIDSTLYTLAEEIEHAILKVSPQVWRTEIKDVRDEFITSRFFVQIVEKPSNKNQKNRIITKSEVISGSIFPKEKAKINTTVFTQPQYCNITNNALTSYPIRLILFPVIKQNNSAYIIQVGTSLKKTYQALDKLLIILLISGPIMLILSSSSTYVLLTRAINPVRDIVDTAKKITTENLSQRIKPKGRADEISQLIKILNQMMERLEESVNQIRQFTGDVSHELRNPLTVIVGETEVMLRKERKSEDYQRSMKIILSESKKMSKMIDNLLFLSSIESPAYNYELKEIPIYEILLDVIKNSKAKLKQKKIKLKLSRLEAVIIKGNDILITQMLINLLDNAYKYTNQKGTIEIELYKENNQAVFMIKDNGIGIEEKYIPHIFNRFYQVDKSRSQANTGHGLGLSIVNKIAVLHKAKIQVQSELNKGTSITILFPKE
jgi:heavy metal sensor kinase